MTKQTPLILLLLGGVLLVVTYFTSLWYLKQGSPGQWIVAYTAMAVAILTMASGITLAYIQTFREREFPRGFRR